MMLQANWHDSSLYIWGRNGEAARDGEAGAASLARVMTHEELRAAIGETSADALLASVGVETSLSLWLPASESGLAAVSVPSLRFGPADAIDLLAPLASDARGADSFRYWAALARFVVDLLGRQQFYPSLAETADGAPLAQWRLLIGSTTLIERLERFAAAMPPVCRAMAEGPPAEAARLVESFLAATADAVIRRDLSVDPFFARVHERAAEAQSPPEVRWLSALLGEDRRVRGDEIEMADLARHAAQWTGRLEESSAGAPPQLCFVLSEPPAGEVEPWRVDFQLRSDEGEARDADELLSIAAAPGELLGRGVMEQRARLLAELRRALAIFPSLERLGPTPAAGGLELSTAEASAFIMQWAGQLRQAGFGVILPEWALERRHDLGLVMALRPLARDDVSSQQSPGASGFEISTGQLGLQSLLEFDWQVAVGDLRLGPDEFAAIAQQHSPLVQYQGRWLWLDEEMANRAAAFANQHKGGKVTLGEALRTAFVAGRADEALPIVGLSGASWVDELLRQAPVAHVSEISQPPAFQGTLRPYQLRGLQWLAFLEGIGLGACLADDMGLGKTIQFIGLLLHERRTGQRPGPTLLFAPTSVVINWVREIQRFGPTLTVLVHHGPDRLHGEAFVAAAEAHDVVVSSYALAHRDREDLLRPRWRRIALDEAQKIKNPYAASTLAIRSLSAPYRAALTGTPIENHLSELWSIMEVLNPGLLGSAAEFRARFAVPVEKLGDRDRGEQLRKMIQPFVLRRSKNDPLVAGDLPEKMEMRIFCNLTREQAAIYQSITQEMLAQVDKAAGMRRRGLVLAGLTRLKQVCDHPALVLRQPGALDGRSGKCERLGEMLEEVVEEGEAALVFTQYRQMGTLLEKLLRERLRAGVQFLHGGTPAKQRQEMVDRFQQAGSDIKVFILSLRAGGLGLNLTAANHVFHFDRWWNPAVEAQATDRAHRIGQTRKVQVHKFVCVGTMEERIDRMLTDKLALADRIVGTGDDWLTDLSTDDLRKAIELTREAVGDF